MIRRVELLKSAGTSLVLAVLVAGCGLARADDPLSGEVVEAKPSVWAATGLPDGDYDYPDSVTLSYHDVSVRRPATDKEWTEEDEEQGADDPNEPATVGIVSATATADTAIFALEPPNGNAEVYRLTESGVWERIGTDLRGIPLADIGGRLVVWAEERDDDGVHLVGYDTERAAVVDTLQPDDLVDVERTVYPASVDGDTVMFDQRLSGEGEPLSSPSSAWTVGSDQPPVRVDNLGVEDRVTSHSTETGLSAVRSTLTGTARLVGPDGRVVNPDLGSDLFGLFNPDGSLLALAGGADPAYVYDTARGQEVPLDLPGEFYAPRFAWTADDRLAVLGSPGDHPQRAYLCTPDTGRCTDLGYDYLNQFAIENSMRGQLHILVGPEGNSE